MPSRGCTAKQLIDSRWWEWLDWLRKTKEHWPKLKADINEEEVNSEMKKSVVLIAVDSTKNSKIFKQFSSFEKLVRFFAIMSRFLNYLKKKEIKSKVLSFEEICDAELKLLRQLQKEMFLPDNDPKLSSIKTFRHSDDLIRVNTRILERKDCFDFLNPIVLDGNHEVVTLLVRETHEKMCHAGVQTIMCLLREKFWIFSIRKIAKLVIKNCIICKI